MGRETKGGEKGKRKEEIEGEIYMQLLTGVWVNLLLIVPPRCTNWTDECWEALRGFQRQLRASCECKHTTAYLP